MKFIKTMSLRQLAGACLVGVSTLAYCAIFVVPFVALETTTKVALVTGLVVAGEVTFYPGVALLGKETLSFGRRVWARCKNAWRRDQETG